MGEKTLSLDFEQNWQNKLTTGLDQYLDPKARDTVLEGGELLTMQSTTQDRIIWSCQMLERLDKVTDKETQQDIMTGCACHYPKAELNDARSIFLETGDVDQVIDLLQAKFEDFLREDLELEEELVLEIISRGWGLAGIRAGRKIISTKIPKSGYLEEYFEVEDPLERRKLYCHCPRVRDGVGDAPHLPVNYCYCGAGFYQGIWETILQEKVRVELLESVIMGGNVCKISIHLPKSIIL